MAGAGYQRERRVDGAEAAQAGRFFSIRLDLLTGCRQGVAVAPLDDPAITWSRLSRR
jgi:hypothetical protein